MYLLRARLAGIGPFDDVSFPFSDEEGRARLVTVIHGGGGVGKTTLLAAISATRPGHSVVQQARPSLLRHEADDVEGNVEEVSPRVVCDWALGQDDPTRPHALCIATPTTRVHADDELESFRRREQAMFDRQAREGGFVLLALPSTRWFSRQPIAIHAPAQSVARYDVRAAAALDDATRSDLARDTKQALAYAGIGAALAQAGSERGRAFDALGDAMRSVVDSLARLSGFSYLGLDAFSLEPIFAGPGGRTLPFDALPTRARHLVAFGALPVRTLWAAYPAHDPRESEGVVLIDEIDVHQDPGVQSVLVAALRSALPRVQWLLTTTSPAVAGSSDTRTVLALRRLPEFDRVQLFVGSEARTH
jgi:hypothetical protein